MKLANFLLNGEPHFGSVINDDVLDFTDAPELVKEKEVPNSITETLDGWDEALEELKELQRRLLARAESGRLLGKLPDVKFLPPIQTPGKILCVFVNYYSHGQEVGSPPSEPYFFFKPSTSIVGDGDDVTIPRFSTKPDHEVELCVVIGRKGKDIRPEEAYDYVAGYTVGNDISFRDGMKRGVVEGFVLGRNLFKGKVADTAFPVGPYLVTKDEVPDPYHLELQLRVNGEVRQHGTTSDMIFKIPDLIACASEANTLHPGDLIATGTCSGVGLYTGKYLADGDLVEAEVEKIGILRNTIRMQRKS